MFGTLQKRWRLSQSWGLPLLAKELREQSSRRRTYVVRTVYATLLFLCAFLMFYSQLKTAVTSPEEVLGQGLQMFELLVMLQFAGIYLFAPALVCGVITHEKERDSLSLVLLTRLSPTTILLEKLASRLVVTFTFELMLLPLLGLAYTFGGVASESFLKAAWFLGLTTLQMGCLALFCSAYFRTTVQSFVASYVVGTLLVVGWPLLNALGVWSYPTDLYSSPPYFEPGVHFSLANQLETPIREIPWLFFSPVMHFTDDLSNSFPLLEVFRGLPILMSSAMLFLLARVFVVRRAFVAPNNLALKAFRFLDGMFLRWNSNRITRGIVVIQPRDSTPDDAPVRWRETTKSTLGRASHLIRMVLFLELPVAAVCALVFATELYSYEKLTVTLLLLVPLVVLIVSVRAAGLIAGERSHQTLDVLLTTPISSREILSQKFASLYRTMLALGIPLLTVVGSESIYRGMRRYSLHPSYYRLNAAWYVMSAIVTLSVYLLLVTWMSFYIGLRSKSRPRAIFSAVAAIVGLCLLPFLLIFLLGIFFSTMQPRLEFFPYLYLLQLTPVSFLIFLESSNFFDTTEQALLGLALNTLLYGGLALIFRWQCLKHADRYLRR